MSHSDFLAAIIGPFFLVLGLSALLYGDVWRKILKSYQKDHLKLLPVMVMELIFGLYIIYTHNLWEWSPYLIVTVAGWGMVLEPAFYFLAPGKSYKALLNTVDCACYCQSFGALSGVLGGWLTYLVYFT